MFYLLASLILFLTTLCHAQDDPNCKDHPLLSRLPNFYIDSCEEKEFDQFQFPDSQGNFKPVEGSYFWMGYVLKEGVKAPSELQIVRNYSNAIQKVGGKIALETRDKAYLQVDKGGATIWIYISAHSVGTQYKLPIIEKKAVAQAGSKS